MGERREFTMSEEQYARLLDASKPVPYMIFSGVAPSSPQENANRVWAALGRELGFDYMTAKPIPGKGARHFSAVATASKP